jgi:glycerophosphoryl diester phosphodiesterase
VNILLDIGANPVVAHRGGRARGPENTLEAMRLGVAAGADAIELDVHRCAGGDVVVIHDATVDRTTDGRGAVGGMTLADLRSLDAGCRFTPVSGGGAAGTARIPTLDEVFEEFAHTAIIIELKTGAASAATLAVIERHAAEDRCIVDSFHAEALAIFRGSRIAHGPARDGVARLIVRSWLGTRRPRVELDVLCIPRRYRGMPLPVARIARLLRREKKPTHIWTVNDPAEADELWRLGVCGIITDDVASIVAARNASQPQVQKGRRPDGPSF